MNIFCIDSRTKNVFFCIFYLRTFLDLRDAVSSMVDVRTLAARGSRKPKPRMLS